MKKLVSLAIAVALALPVTALAGDLSSFHALSQMPAEEQIALTPLTDEQLAAREGSALSIRGPNINITVPLPRVRVTVPLPRVRVNVGRIVRVIVRGRDVIRITQVNVSTNRAAVQRNVARVVQR